MPTIPTDPPLPGTIPLSPRLRLHGVLHEEDPGDAGSLLFTREQLLRAKQLLLQLRELHQHPASATQSAFSKNLAMLRMAIRTLETGDLSSATD